MNLGQLVQTHIEKDTLKIFDMATLTWHHHTGKFLYKAAGNEVAGKCWTCDQKLFYVDEFRNVRMIPLKTLRHNQTEKTITKDNDVKPMDVRDKLEQALGLVDEVLQELSKTRVRLFTADPLVTTCLLTYNNLMGALNTYDSQQTLKKEEN